MLSYKRTTSETKSTARFLEILLGKMDKPHLKGRKENGLYAERTGRKCRELDLAKRTWE